MSKILPSTPRRGAFRSSHLRQVSNGSVGSSSSNTNTNTTSRPISISSDTGTAQYAPIPPKIPIEKRCNLSVHDEPFSKDEVVLNLDFIPGIKAGDLMAIVGLKTDTSVRDFQEKLASKKDVDYLNTTMQRERSGSNPKSPIHNTGSNSKHDVDHGKGYVFIAKDMPKDLKAKNPTLEVSILKHIADVFCFKHRSIVLLTEVSFFACALAFLANEDSRQILAVVQPLMFNYPLKMNIWPVRICGGWL